MPILTVLFVLVVVGILLWLVNTYVPMDSKLKLILNIVAVLLVILWLLKVFGLIDSMKGVTV